MLAVSEFVDVAFVPDGPGSPCPGGDVEDTASEVSACGSDTDLDNVVAPMLEE